MQLLDHDPHGPWGPQFSPTNWSDFKHGIFNKIGENGLISLCYACIGGYCAPYFASKDNFIATLTKHYGEVFPTYPNAARFGRGWAGSALISMTFWLEKGASALQTEDLSHFQYLLLLLPTSVCQIATSERLNLCHIKPFLHLHGWRRGFWPLCCMETHQLCTIQLPAIHIQSYPYMP